MTKSPESTPKFCVPLTPSYRLTAEESGSIRNFTLQRRVIVDPTKAPGFPAKLAADPTLDTALTEKWRDDGYYPITSVGLTAAITSVVIRTVVADEPQDLADMLRKINSEIERIVVLVDAVFNKSHIPVKFSEMSEEDRRESIESMRDLTREEMRSSTNFKRRQEEEMSSESVRTSYEFKRKRWK